MKIDRLDSTVFPVTRWSGGSTAQVRLYPDTATLRERNFLWRLSMAEVACDESVFSDFTGYNRILGLRRGQMELQFAGHGGALLRAGDTVRFSGGWKTVSRGQAGDLNLILREGAAGSMRVFSLDGILQWRRPALAAKTSEGCCWFLYLQSGALAAGDGLGPAAQAGDFLQFSEWENCDTIRLTGRAELFEIGVCW